VRWDDVVAAATSELDANATLAALGIVLERSEYGPRVVPGLRYTVVADSAGETLAEVLIQFDLWAESREQAAVIEREIRRLRRDHFRDLAGLKVVALVQESRDMGDPQPGVVHRSVDMRFVVVRAQL
jgi:hypothetical protein